MKKDILKKMKSSDEDDLEVTLEKVMQVANASSEQLELYKTQTLVKLDILIRVMAKNVRIMKNLMIAGFIILLIIALLI